MSVASEWLATSNSKCGFNIRYKRGTTTIPPPHAPTPSVAGVGRQR
ncbi:hypothetical protein AVEN_31626-1, partial [Araneus ventricosus]